MRRYLLLVKPSVKDESSQAIGDNIQPVGGVATGVLGKEPFKDDGKIYYRDDYMVDGEFIKWIFESKVLLYSKCNRQHNRYAQQVIQVAM